MPIVGVTYVPEHVLPISPVYTKGGRGVRYLIKGVEGYVPRRHMNPRRRLNRHSLLSSHRPVERGGSKPHRPLILFHPTLRRPLTGVPSTVSGASKPACIRLSVCRCHSVTLCPLRQQVFPTPEL